jgi:flagellar protein FlgJ
MPKDNTNLYILGGAGLLAALLLAEQAAWNNAVKPKSDGSAPVPPGSPSEFLRRMHPYTIQSEAATGVPAYVTLAQAGIESAYGKSAPGNNFFGVKAGKTWQGETQLLKTWEVGKTGDPSRDGIRDQIIQVFKPGQAGNPFPKFYSYRVYGKFRKYPTPAEGFKDHANFLRVNTRYKAAFNYKDPVKFAEQVARAGYATAPNYESALKSTISIIRKVLG